MPPLLRRQKPLTNSRSFSVFNSKCWLLSWNILIIYEILRMRVPGPALKFQSTYNCHETFLDVSLWTITLRFQFASKSKINIFLFFKSVSYFIPYIMYNSIESNEYFYQKFLQNLWIVLWYKIMKVWIHICVYFFPEVLLHQLLKQSWIWTWWKKLK